MLQVHVQLTCLLSMTCIAVTTCDTFACPDAFNRGRSVQCTGSCDEATCCEPACSTSWCAAPACADGNGCDRNGTCYCYTAVSSQHVLPSPAHTSDTTPWTATHYVITLYTVAVFACFCCLTAAIASREWEWRSRRELAVGIGAGRIVFPGTYASTISVHTRM